MVNCTNMKYRTVGIKVFDGTNILCEGLVLQSYGVLMVCNEIGWYNNLIIQP